MKYSYVIVFIIVVISSCKKDNDPIIYGYHYFPMTEGQYTVYDVVDIFHDVALLPAHDTNYYQIKEVIGEEELDGEGQPYQKLYRFIRLSDTLEWSLKDVWTVKRTSTAAETLEENKRRINLAFSISYDQIWNYNALNEDEATNARYENIYEPMTVGGIDYDSTVVVEIQNQLNFIEYKRQFDVYAANYGRVLKVRKDLDILNTDTTNITKGTEMFYTAVEFGFQ